ncbi:MAG: hypothetical protein ACOX0H_00140 [Patescibacteria group bacterium]
MIPFGSWFCPALCQSYNLIVCRTFFEGTLPDELLEAAQIDGCSDLGFFFRIALPLSGAITAVLALFYASTKWNSYFDGLIYLMDERKMPLQIVLRNLLLIGQSQNMVSGDAKSLAERKSHGRSVEILCHRGFCSPSACGLPLPAKILCKGVF